MNKLNKLNSTIKIFLVVFTLLFLLICVISPNTEVTCDEVIIGPFHFKINCHITPTPTISPVVTSEITPQIGITKVRRENRDWNHYFKSTKTYYNVFTSGEVKNAFKVEMEYSSDRRNSDGFSCTGTREVYVRNKSGEEYGNDSQWIKVGEFEYNHEGQVVSVVIDWSDTRGPLDVCSMAIIRENGSSDESFHNDWGDNVQFYSYIY